MLLDGEQVVWDTSGLMGLRFTMIRAGLMEFMNYGVYIQGLGRLCVSTPSSRICTVGERTAVTVLGPVVT